MPALYVITTDPQLYLDRDGAWRSVLDPRASIATFDDREEAEAFARSKADERNRILSRDWHVTVRKV